MPARLPVPYGPHIYYVAHTGFQLLGWPTDFHGPVHYASGLICALQIDDWTSWHQLFDSGRLKIICTPGL